MLAVCWQNFVGILNGLSAAVGGAACLLCGVTTGWLQRALAIFGKLGCAAALNLAFLYTSELFPTVVRSTALGITSQVVPLGLSECCDI